MKSRLRRVRLRDLALFAAVAAVVAVVVVFAGREAGVGERAGADAEQPRSQAEQPRQEGGEGERRKSDPLTLTLGTLYSVCETKPARGYHTGRQYIDDEGNHRVEYTDVGWRDPQYTPVEWAVTGGTPPYELTLDGERRDGFGPYEGADGWALVSCALEIGETFFRVIDTHSEIEYLQRWHRTEPRVDSGWKTIRATVTDATGASVAASVEIYVVLDVGERTGRILRSGETYRVAGLLLTVPKGFDFEIGGSDSSGPNLHLLISGVDYHSFIVFNTKTGGEYWRSLPNVPVLTPAERAEQKARAAASGESYKEHAVNAAYDQLLDSVGDPPPSGSD